MTFEEFFTKKRIDLALLRSARPDLYEEFYRHYTQMGEKSFDHTKKYWFNRLRKEFLLEVAEVPKELVATESAVAGNKGVESSTMATKPSGFKPRFRAGATPTVAKPAGNSLEVPESSETLKAEAADDKSTVPTKKAVGFKPRFKAGHTALAKSAADAKSQDGDVQQGMQSAGPTSQAKPIGFKPRFKAGVTPVKKSDGDENPGPDAPEPTIEPPISTAMTTKPLGFKPRFKAGKTTDKKG